MAVNLDKFKLDERIRFSYLKHRGDVVAVSEETKADLVYVRKVCDKYKKQQKRDVGCWVASNVFQCILEGYYQRISQLQRYLNELESQEINEVSSCCKVPVEFNLIYAETRCFCTKCEKECALIKVNDKWVYNFRLEIIRVTRRR